MRPDGPLGRNTLAEIARDGALSIDGIEALMTIEGGTTAAVFLKLIDEHLKL